MKGGAPEKGALANAPADYSDFDFSALWTGRDRVTRVETRIVEEWIDRADARRVLEIGTGFGRLTPTLRSRADEYVGLDADPGGIQQAAGRSGPRDPRARWVLGNLFYLPFAPETFTAITMVRVAHHLPDFGAAVREIFRVLASGGSFLVSTAPRPTLGTLIEDVKASLACGGSGDRRWATFATGPVAQIRGPPRPVFVAPREYYRDHLRSAGFEIGVERGSGLEEFAPFLPERFCVRAGAEMGRLPLFSLNWYAALRPGPRLGSLGSSRSILACPACRSPLAAVDEEEAASLRCPSCGRAWGSMGGIRDLRWPRPETAPP